MKNRERVQVVDITVRHEDGDLLAQGQNEKIEKYSRLIPYLRERMGATHGEVLPIVVGSRGAMPRETVKSLATLGIKDRKTLLTISLIALRNSLELYHEFMDYDAPRQRRQYRNRQQVRADSQHHP